MVVHLMGELQQLPIKGAAAGPNGMRNEYLCVLGRAEVRGRGCQGDRGAFEARRGANRQGGATPVVLLSHEYYQTGPSGQVP